jgi:apolipoprotein N-acyltransferase
VIDAFALRLAALGGWAKLVVALLAGALTIFAFPSFSVVPALWVAFPVLFWLLDGCRTWKAAFFVGWAFGAGYFATGLYWMANAFYVDADAFGAFAIPAVGSLAIAMGLFIAIVCALTHIVPPADVEEMSYERASVTARRILLFAAVWTFVEWIRSWIFTGLPWNPLGLVWSETRTPVGLPVLQVAALIGTYGLSFLTVLFAAAPAVLGYTPRLRWAWLTAGAPLAVMLIVGAGGALRLAIAPDDLVPGVKFRLVQANVSQADRSRPSLWVRHLEDYVRLSNEARPADVTHVVWGEAAIAFFLNIDEPARRVAAMAAPANGMLITGADRGVRGETGQAVYNSLYVVRPDASIAAVYDKTHLVPFGEYTPLRDLVPFDEITGMSGGFAAGTGLATLEVAGLPPFTPLICYEVIFSGDVTPGGQPRPAWLLNLTNDSWFGLSLGPHQHFAQARLRAVEEGLPLVRAANTGISAVIDGYGQVQAALPLGTRGVLDASLPQPVNTATPFALLGNFTSLLLATCGGAYALFFSRGGTAVRLQRFRRSRGKPTPTHIRPGFR